MHRKFIALASALLGLMGFAVADPTWPASTDDLEEIMYQLTSFRARKFADIITPCSNQAAGPGRQNSAEWLRSAFHDMSTADIASKTGGLDGSLQYELDRPENGGPGHRTTLEYMSNFVSPQTSLADVIAAAVYASVRSCGGPIIPVRGGRIDATEAGVTGVPEVDDSITKFRTQFKRMGLDNTEMIQLTACGHTLGGVHNNELSGIVAHPNVNNGLGGFDDSVADFDNKVVTEYLSGDNENPLATEEAARKNEDSDFKVYNSDGNKTMEAMRESNKFRQVCQAVLQKMIDVVPGGVRLTEPVVPYKVKPVSLKLLLVDGGANLHFSGYIRVKTTGKSKDSVSHVEISYKNRKGQSECGQDDCIVDTKTQSFGAGFDDAFTFFPIDAKIPVSTGISSFTVKVYYSDGTDETEDNNGHGYSLQDTILLQKPQSCVVEETGQATLVAAVHNSAISNGAKATIYYKTAQKDSPLPKFSKVTVSMDKGQCVGQYTLFNIHHKIEGETPHQSFVDVSSSDKSDSFNSVTDIGGSCDNFESPQKCDLPAVPSQVKPRTFSIVRVRAVSPTLDSLPLDSPIPGLSSLDAPAPTPVPPSNPTSPGTPTTAPPSAAPVPTPTHKTVLGGYTMSSCWSEGSIRALSGASTANDTMTLEKCMDFCKGYNYWGTEYGRECYCGNSLGSGSKAAPLSECDMACGGDPTEFCGAGNRLELYSTTISISTPTGTLSHKPTISPYTMVGCWTEGTTDRALGATGTSGADMTNEKCATFCKGYRYFGTEYGSECYCGSYLSTDSKSAPVEDCSMTCAGDQFEYCGASSRLELYMNANATGGEPVQPPTAGDFVLVGCQTEGNGTRALGGTTTSDGKMTNTACATFCAGSAYFGTEYGSECYCGSELAASSAVAPKGECNMLCAGSEVEFCGGPDRLSVYKKKATTPGNGTAEVV